MRDIKFRCWTGDEMLYEGWNKDFFVTKEMIFRYDNVMQFTGLKDKNGVEIYEGDIIKSVNGQIKSATVVFHQAAFWYHYNDPMYGEQHEEICHWVSNRIAVEVIGNIYQSPELTSQPITTTELPNIHKSTENLSKIKDKDEWLREIRGSDEITTPSGANSVTNTD